MLPDKLLQNMSLGKDSNSAAETLPRETEIHLGLNLSQPPPSGCGSLHGSASPVCQEDAVPGGEYLMHHL